LNINEDKDKSLESIDAVSLPKRKMTLDKRITFMTNVKGPSVDDQEKFDTRSILLVDDQSYNIDALMIILASFHIDTD